MSTQHQDPRVPPREQCVVRYLIDRWAEERPDTVYAIFESGETWTYRELRERVRAAATGLSTLGVEQDDHVAVWLFGGAEGIVTFFAINYLGAVFVPFNTAYKGNLLEHVLDNSDAKLLVAHRDLIPRLADADTAALSQVVAVGGAPQSCVLPCETFEAVAASADAVPDLRHPIEPWHNQSIIYTSGTTSRPKGVVHTHASVSASASRWVCTGRLALDASSSSARWLARSQPVCT